MGDCGEDYSALRELNRERKAQRQDENHKYFSSAGLTYDVDASGSMHFATDKGKVIFYPTTNKYQHKGRVRYGNAAACEKYIRSLLT